MLCDNLRGLHAITLPGVFHDLCVFHGATRTEYWLENGPEIPCVGDRWARLIQFQSLPEMGINHEKTLRRIHSWCRYSWCWIRVCWQMETGGYEFHSLLCGDIFGSDFAFVIHDTQTNLSAVCRSSNSGDFRGIRLFILSKVRWVCIF